MQLHSGELRGAVRQPPARGHSPEGPFKIDLQDGTEGQLHVPRRGRSGLEPTFWGDCMSLSNPDQRWKDYQDTGLTFFAQRTDDPLVGA